MHSRIIGTGHYVPSNVITNNDLAQIMPTSDEWITERTGIKERRYFTPGEDTVSSMSAKASRMALKNAGITEKDVDMIVMATITSEYYFPGSGVLLQRELGLPGIPALDIKMQCSGFIYALSIADQFIRSGTYKNVLVVGAEIQSNAIEHSERGRNIAVIFGDGAGAVVLQATNDEKHRVLSTHLHSDGTYAEELVMKHPGSVLENRITHEMLDEALIANGLVSSDIDLLIPHQANLRISEFIREKFGMPESKVFNNIQKYGNTTAASIPIALSEAVQEGRLKSGDLLCLAAFGSGFTWASALIRW
jgi:3-oxoacyl-[acyl-carrier-protein] synthase-3